VAGREQAAAGCVRDHDLRLVLDDFGAGSPRSPSCSASRWTA
jgi:hypothetical protein